MLRTLVVLIALLTVAPTAIVFLTAFLAVCLIELPVTAWYACIQCVPAPIVTAGCGPILP